MLCFKAISRAHVHVGSACCILFLLTLLYFRSDSAVNLMLQVSFHSGRFSSGYEQIEKFALSVSFRPELIVLIAQRHMQHFETLLSEQAVHKKYFQFRSAIL